MREAPLPVGGATSGEGFVGLMLRLRSLGITDPALLKAVESAPHERFIPGEQFAHAWSATSMPLACGQMMMPPDITVRMVEALGVLPSHAVLEIGTGSGFQTAILSALAQRVHTIDRYRTLVHAASERLRSLGRSNVTFTQADGSRAGQGLYDRIITDLAFEEQPRYLLENLTVDGAIVAPIGAPGSEQTIARLTRIGNRFEREDLFAARFPAFEKGIAEAL